MDDRGRLVFVDDISKVPHACRSQLEIRGSQLTQERRAEMELERQQRLGAQQQHYLRQFNGVSS
jgi:hypothetical protein